MFKRLLGTILMVGILVTQSVPQAAVYAQTLCDQAQFISDISVPDGSSFAPGAAFTKTWRLKNIGTCTWTNSYTLIWAGGDQMGAPASMALPVSVAPGQTADLSVNLTSPTAAGHYKGLWKLANASGIPFGIGNTASTAFWVDINVGQAAAVQNAAAQTVTWTAFDFLEYAQASVWWSGAGQLSFPGVTGDSRGFANFVNQPHLEDGSFDTNKGLLMAPQNKTDGYIQMTTPNVLIAQGDKLQTRVSCEYDAKSCYVTFRIDYLKANGAQYKFWSWKEAFDGRYYDANIDLSPLAGQAVRFVFMTLATGSASGDRALWVAPRITRTNAGLTPVPPTVTPVPGTTPPPSSGGVVNAPIIRQLFMKDVFNGWAIGDSYLIRTTNGGTTWTNVTPQNATFVNGATGFFMNSTTAWFLTGESKLYRTTNGGTTWTAYSAPFGNGYMQFTDTYHGFVLNGLGSGMNKQAVALYKTNDGGATWIKNYDNTPTLPTPGTSLPFSGHKNGMTFRDSLAGWVGGDIPMDGYFYFYRTVDAGKNWSQQTLSIPTGYESAFMTLTAPTFFGTSNALLPVWMGRTEGRDLATYVTTNGGISWTRTAGFAKGAEFVDYFSSKGGFAWDHSGVFQVTSNAGGTWTFVKPNIDFGDDFRGMDFVSATTGWVIQTHPDNSTSLYKTTDGAATWTLLSTNQPGGTPTDTPVPSTCDKAAFVTDVTIADGTIFSPNTPFTKTWRLKNSGTCTWTTSYKLVFQTGDQMSGPASVNLPTSVAPDQTIDLSVNLTAPATAGHYRGYWMLSNASGALFGIGTDSNSPFWVDINVSGSTATNTAYDFTANVCAAQWKSGAGTLPCPGTDGSSTGYVLKLDAPVLEDGSTGAPGLLTMPQNKYDGYIQGFYPEFTVQAGDRFQAKVGCQQGQSCYVTYRLNYMTTSGWIGTFWQWRESNDGKYYTADIDLTPLAGKKVKFILTILATGYATGDRAIWSAPRIYRLGAGAPPTAAPPTQPTAGPTSQTIDWPFFTSPQYGFNIQYPPGSVVFNSVPESAIINMPITAGTTLVEKYLSFNVVPNATTCTDPVTGSTPLPESVTINGTTWLKDVGADAGMSQLRAVTQYTTTRNNICYSFLFVLHSASAFEPPRPDYDAAAESAVFTQMMQSFGWLASAPDTSTSASTVPTATATFTPVPATSPAAFAQSIVDGLNAHDFNGVKAKMGTTFATGFWGSQGTASTPDQAIEAFQNLYVGTTPLVSDSSQDLMSLLGGMNPYAIMNLDAAKSYALFVSGLGTNGQAEAIFYVNTQTDGSLYFYGMLYAPTKFIHVPTATPSPTPSTPVVLTGPYAVVRVAAGDVLNIRSAAGSTNPIVGSFAAEATNVMRTGPTQTAEGAEWVQVQNPSGGTGWVNSSYLTEQVTHEAFCSDSRILPFIDQFKQALNSSDGNLLSTLVSPTHGVNFRLWKYSAGVDFTTNTAKNIFTDLTAYDWGGGPSGTPDVGTFSNEVQPNYLDALNAPNREVYCDNLTKVFPLSDPWPNHTIRYYNIYKPATPNIYFDFRSLLIGIEFVNNQPYLYSVITIVWEP